MRIIEGTLDPEGTIRFHETLHLTRPHRVLVTLLEDELPERQGESDHPESLLSLLTTPEFRKRPLGSAEELEAVIEQIRESWNE